MKNIIITGGELFNKGAQAMTFIAVDELHRRFPNHQLYLLSEMDMERPTEEKACFNFEFMGWYPLKFAKCQTNTLLRWACLIRNGAELKATESIYQNCEAMVDISGYALSSDWTDFTCNHYLDHLEFAEAFHIPVYLMPQSFGPFNFGPEREDLDYRIRKLLPTAKMIFAREQEGYDALIKQYDLTNVHLANDLVLSNKEVDLSRVFRTVPKIALPQISENSVAVIPNNMNTIASSNEETVYLYSEIIRVLLGLGKKVYLISHSTMDKDLCRTLKCAFRDDKMVILQEQEFSCLEFNELVKHFQFLVASRFHAIVHAYKNSVPCVVLGWATKYHALLKQFGQEQYALDIRNGVEVAEMQRAISQMNQKYLKESKTISGILQTVQKENTFDTISIVQEGT